MSEPTVKAPRVPDAAIAAFSMVVLLAMLTNPVSLGWIADQFDAVGAFLGRVSVTLIDAFVTALSWVTPW